RLGHHEALRVIIVDGSEIEQGVARQRPGRVARENVDLAGLERLEPILGRERRILDLGRVIEDRRSDTATEIDIEAGPGTLVVGAGESGQSLARAPDK